MDVREKYVGKECTDFVEKLLTFIGKILKHSEKNSFTPDRMAVVCNKQGIRKALGIESNFERARKILVEEVRVMHAVELINEVIDLLKSEPYTDQFGTEFYILNNLVNVSIGSAKDCDLATIEANHRLDPKAVHDILDALDVRLGTLIHTVFENQDSELKMMFQFSGLLKTCVNIREWSFSYNRNTELLTIASEPKVDFELHGSMRNFLKIKSMDEGNVDAIIENIRDYFNKYSEAATLAWHHMNHARLFSIGTGSSLGTAEFPTFEQFKTNSDLYANNPYAMIVLLQSRVEKIVKSRQAA